MDKARVIRELLRRAGAALRDAAKRVVRSSCAALLPRSVLGGFVADLTRTREELLAENAALRQQLIVLECLDHVLILSESHTEHIRREYATSYFNAARPHQGLGQRVPVANERDSFASGAKVVASSVVGGLHHDYQVAA